MRKNRNGKFDNEKVKVQAQLTDGRHHYKVFGLHVSSDILLPELLTAADLSHTPEVDILLGKVPAGIKNALETTKYYQTTEKQFLLHVPGVGRYFVTQGNCIVIEREEQAADDVLRFFLLGTVFGALLLQREVLPIHGSAVNINGCAVIFTGVSGAGKSTLLAAFRDRGYAFLTDDVAAVTIDEGGIAWVSASYPQQKLWRDSAETMGIDTASLPRIYVSFNRDKFKVPVNTDFCPSAVPLAAVYELGAERCENVSLRHLAGMNKLTVLMRHTYRPSLIDALGIKTTHFKHCAAVARQIAVSKLTRPEGVFSLDAQVRLVQQDVAQLLAGKRNNAQKKEGVNLDVQRDRG